MPPSLDQARVALAAQPFSRLLGARLNRFGPDGVELRVPVCPATANSTGSPWWAARLCGRQCPHLRRRGVAGPEGLTAGYTINVLAPVLGDRLLA